MECKVEISADDDPPFCGEEEATDPKEFLVQMLPHKKKRVWGPIKDPTKTRKLRIIQVYLKKNKGDIDSEDNKEYLEPIIITAQDHHKKVEINHHHA